MCAIRWYLRYSLSLRDVEQLFAERGLEADPRAVSSSRPTNPGVSMRHIFESRAVGYLHRAIDSTGATIDFLLSALRDAAAAKRLFRQALSDRHPQPRVIKTDQACLYGAAIAAVKAEGTLRRRCRHRPVECLNNILEQDHRAIKRRVKAKQSFRKFQAARRTIDRYEAIHDPQGASAVGQRRRYLPTESVHRQAVRSGCLRPRRPFPIGTSCVTVFKVATLRNSGLCDANFDAFRLTVRRPQ